MTTAFDQLNDNARIWIFQSSAPIDPGIEQVLLDEIDAFLKKWAAHGADLMASATLLHRQFIVLGIDEQFNMASGCSIDSMMRFMQELAEKHNLNLFDRTLLAFLKQNKVETVELKALKSLIAQGYFENGVLFFNNTVQTKGDLQKNWLVKPEESWLKRYFDSAKSVL
ncbi:MULTISPECIES: hypothetical protein [Roseivirga]|uniref:ABC transporter ATPase n=1 Tax=Roseivirga thermotolerans TaxID=1758176 RepID=A0ABQ3I0Y7_9BACT|nr:MULTISPECIES: hypothetical protein [Roseivirga]GHE54078.1 hypothetical protein GCM10011340_05800 [Roseivirga thermotolerans]|tara:strand:- start:2797 stop:3300 length:504 start_codon:yes stop_codon:yes gene_type:complete